MTDKPPAQIPLEYCAELRELCASTPDGCIIELGVYKGGSAWEINQVARGRKLHLFDTFTGIPEKSDIDNFAIGAFSDTSALAVEQALPAAQLHIGVFPGTFPPALTDIAFAHIDCDQYETCKAAIELFWPRMVPGGIIAWDDYPFDGIKKAIHDFFGDKVLFTTLKIPYVIKGDT